MSVDDLVSRISQYIIDPIILLLFALGLLYFLWGVAIFIWQSDSEDARKKGVQHMLWGIIGMFIMIAALGIINLIEGTFGL